MKSKTIAWILGIIIVLIIFSWFALPHGKVIEDSSFIGKKFVTKVLDGDTVIIGGASVRLLGIDADEPGYSCYAEAKKRIEELILNKEITLERDQEDKDQYQRYLRYIFLNGKNINLQLVKEGLAVARFFPENVKYKEDILNAEREAREFKRGCKWGEQKSDDGFEEPWPTPNSGDVIGACNAGNYVGEEKIVEGKIVDTYKYKATSVFLNLEKPYPNSCFTAVIWSSDWDKFPENPEDYYNGKTVRITGKIIEYKGTLEIILKDMSQIEVIR